MKRVAIIGDANSIWVRAFVNEVISDCTDFEVTIFSDKYNHKTAELYNFDNVTVCDCRTSVLWEKVRLGKFLYWRKIKNKVSELACFDLIHIQFVNRRKLFLIKYLRNHYKKAIVTFWGSDLLRKNNSELQDMIEYLDYADAITVGSEDMKKFFCKHFPVNLINRNHVVHYGVNSLKEITDFDIPIIEVKKKWLIPIDKFVVTIGYNGSTHQNHLIITKQLSYVSESIKNDIFIIIPASYGLNDSYYYKLRSLLKSSNFNFLIVKDYMNAREIAELCHITDVFIHGQTTDALSASVQEYLCAGKLLFNPVWINYDELKRKSIYYLEYEKFEELPSMVEKLVKCGIDTNTMTKLKQNRDKINEMSSWGIVKQDWLKLYQSMER